MITNDFSRDARNAFRITAGFVGATLRLNG